MGSGGREHRLVATSRRPDDKAVLEAVVDISDDAVFSLDAEGHITSWNRSAERIFGHPESDIVGRELTVLFPPHLRR
jgi:PAS domain S-box-containing protein